jgi:hypothetical protein
MKPFKSSFDSKDDRKEAFSNALSSLIKKQKVVDNGETQISMADKDKKSKKRKHESSDDDNIKAAEESNKQTKTDETKSMSTADNINSQPAATPEKKVYPVPTGNITILLFYAYCTPQMTRGW